MVPFLLPSHLPIFAPRNNIEGTLNLVECMQAQEGCRKLVFSSSATVYGEPDKLPLDEHSSVGVGITNPYGKFLLWVLFHPRVVFNLPCVLSESLPVTNIRTYLLLAPAPTIVRSYCWLPHER